MIKKLMETTFAVLLCCAMFFTATAAHAQESGEVIQAEVLLQMDIDDQLDFLIRNGLELPPDYDTHRELASSFIEKYLPIILDEGYNFKGCFNYDQSNALLDSLTQTVETLGLIEPFSENRIVRNRYVLQDSTAIGSWSSSYVNYNCYAYALGLTTWHNPGSIKYPTGNPFSLTMSASQIADLVLEDLSVMNYTGYKQTGKPTSLSNGYNKVICIRKANSSPHDYHFMRMNGTNLNQWQHKPGDTQPLQWNYTNPGYKNWTNEYKYMDWCQPGDTTYNSTIYYIIYKYIDYPGV